MSEDTIITKAALARELEVSKARVSQLITRGLPVRTDGKIDRDLALAWVKRSVTRPNRLDRVNTGAFVGATKALAVNVGEDNSPTFADDDAGPNLDDISALSTVATLAASDAALVMLRAGITPETVRQLAEEIARLVIKGAVALVDEDYEPPAGHTSWATHPWFANQLAADWDELVEIAAAG